MADQPVTREKLINADIDVENLGKAVNELGTVNPRYGSPYKTAPQTIQDLQQKADQVVAQGFYQGYTTEALLLAAKPAVAEMRARADDTRKIYRWNRTSAEGVTPVTGTWTDTGLSDKDLAQRYADERFNPLLLDMYSKYSESSSKFEVIDWSKFSTYYFSAHSNYLMNTVAFETLCTISGFTIATNSTSISGLKLAIVEKSSNTYTTVKEITPTDYTYNYNPATKVMTVNGLDVSVSANQYIGVFFNGIAYLAAEQTEVVTAIGAYFYNGWNTSPNNKLLPITFNIKKWIGIKERIDQISETISNGNKNKDGVQKMTMIDVVKSFSTSFAYSGFTLNSSNLLMSGEGDNKAIYNKRFISDMRKCQFHLYKSLKSGIVRVGSTFFPTINTAFETCVEVDFDNLLLKIYKFGSTSTILASVAISQTLTASTDYVVEIGRNKKLTYVKLINSLTQAEDYVEYDGSGLYYVNSAGNHRPYYAIYTNKSGDILRKICVFGSYQPDFLHVGDSLSESNGRADANNAEGKNWVEILIERMGGGVIAAQSGMSAQDAITALYNEVRHIKPKQLSIMIGTNGGITDDQVQSIIDFASTSGIPLIMHHIPMTEGRRASEASSAKVVNARLDSFNLHGARMDVATALNGVVSNGYDSTLFSSDKIHANQAGNIKMYKQALIDCPELTGLVKMLENKIT